MCYVLILRLEKGSRVRVGRLGEVKFKPGYYYYVGSAKKGNSRICRHFRREKKMRWHIDYLSVVATPLLAYILNKEECDTAKKLSKSFEAIPGFGCSDCSCKTHLFYSKEFTELDDSILKPEDCQQNGR